MAIPYTAGKLFETSSLSKVQIISVGVACKAGSLVAIAIGGEDAGTLAVSSVVDSKGNTWRIDQLSGSTMVAIITSRLSVALASTDTITVTLNQTPAVCWKSGHNFEGADKTPLDVVSSSATSTAAYVTVDVSGSDWLALGIAYWPSDGLVTTTEVDSSLSRDNIDGGSYAAEFWSCNGSAGSTTRIGATVASAKYRKAIGISLPFRALNTAKAPSGMFMGV